MTHGIRTVGVVGLGTMGAGIAQVVAHHGYDVVASEVSGDLVQAGLARIGAGFGRHVERGRMTAAEREGALARVAGTTDLDAFAGCDLVVEAIVEDIDAKRDLFARLEGICRPDAILATNTSAISITEIAAATSTAERVVGMHFFNPAPVLPLVEVIVGDRTSATVAERVREFAEAIGKRPVLCPDRPGFVTIIANYVPLEGPAGGPNFYEFGDDVLYDILIDNDGDGKPEIVYAFEFENDVRNPDTFLYNTGPDARDGDANLNVQQTATITKSVRGVGDTVIGSDLPVQPVRCRVVLRRSR